MSDEDEFEDEDEDEDICHVCNEPYGPTTLCDCEREERNMAYE